AENKKAEDVGNRGRVVQLVGGIGDDGGARGGVDERAKVDLSEGNDEAGINRQQHEEIEFAAPDEFGKVGAVDQEKRLEDLLDEMTRAHEHDDLPFGPGADLVGVQI